MFQPCLFYPRVISQHDSFKERWFAGTHGDVGGGWPEPKAGLAKISLEWMYNEAERAGARLDPDKRAYFLGHSSEYSSVERRFFGQPAKHGGGPSRVAKTPPSVLAGVNDPFADAWVWNLLECVPRRGWSENGKRWRGPHWWGRRSIPIDATLHPSVEQKLAEDPEYRPGNLHSSVKYGE